MATSDRHNVEWAMCLCMYGMQSVHQAVMDGEVHEGRGANVIAEICFEGCGVHMYLCTSHICMG